MVNYNLTLKHQNESHFYKELSGHQLIKIINRHLEHKPLYENSKKKWSCQLTYNYFNRPQNLNKKWFQYLQITSSKNNHKNDFTAQIKGLEMKIKKSKKKNLS
jgi:hypothetical protein